MPRTQRVAQYIQRLAYISLVKHEERDERPDDVLSPEPETPNYECWNATSFSMYVPFRSPTNG
jgi:hypothetical protein